MASELIVQTLKGPTTGANANKVIIPSGQTLDINAWTPPSGTLVQYVHQQITPGSQSTTSNSFVATSCSLSITPKYADSHLLIRFNTRMTHHSPSTSAGGRLTIYRDGTADIVTGNFKAYCRSTSQEIYWPVMLEAEDAPNTTSQVTYTLYMLSNNSGNTFIAVHGDSSVQMSIMEFKV